MHLMYILGEPGTGKSTLMAELVKGRPFEKVYAPFLHLVYGHGACMLGGLREEYPGTDMLAFDASPKVVHWLGQATPPLVLGEGARLGTRRFLLSAQSIGYALHLYHLVSTGEARARRKERSRQQQDPFAKGQATKSAALAKEFGALDISPTMPPDFLVKMLTDPVSMSFR